MKNQKESICPVCNKAFIGANSATYCSAKCRKTAAKKRKQKEIAERRLTCAYCGAVFQSAKKRKYCELCQEKDRRKRKPRERVKPKLYIEDIAKLSRGEGLSYGEYVKKYGL